MQHFAAVSREILTLKNTSAGKVCFAPRSERNVKIENNKKSAVAGYRCSDRGNVRCADLFVRRHESGIRPVSVSLFRGAYGTAGFYTGCRTRFGGRLFTGEFGQPLGHCRLGIRHYGYAFGGNLYPCGTEYPLAGNSSVGAAAACSV